MRLQQVWYILQYIVVTELRHTPFLNEITQKLYNTIYMVDGSFQHATIYGCVMYTYTK